jgi:hypothetical protein
MTATATATSAATTATNAIVIRHATDADICVLADLAILDSRDLLKGPALIAEVDGVVRAALDLSDGSVAADPFFPTTDVVELLRVHAKSVTPQPSRLGSVWGRLATLGTVSAQRAGA